MMDAHQPVLLGEVAEHLCRPGVMRVVDGTLGYGGHAAALLQRLPQAELLGIDRDMAALRDARARLEAFGDRAHFAHGDFASMAEHAADLGWDRVDAVLLDLGVSSPQLDTPQRGFSFRHDGPLDMRMDRTTRLTAATIVNTWSEDELVRIFREYGEERHARRVARAVVRRRAERPWARTGELAELFESVIGRHRSGGLPPATRGFQALRIAVNDELQQLHSALVTGVDMLAVGGRFAVISFHSLEDRMVKHAFRYEAATCVCPPESPVCRCGKVARVKVLTRKPIQAGDDELARNPRASSAKLRVAERLPDSDDTTRPDRERTG